MFTGLLMWFNYPVLKIVSPSVDLDTMLGDAYPVEFSSVTDIGQGIADEGIILLQLIIRLGLLVSQDTVRYSHLHL